MFSTMFSARVRPWFFLGCAIIFEVAGTSVMKLSQSGHLLGENAGLAAMFLLVGLSYYCLSLAVRNIAVGVAFAFWEGLGLTLITLVSVLALGEHMNFTRALALAAVLGGAMLVHHGTEEGHASDDGAQDTQGTSREAPESASLVKEGN